MAARVAFHLEAKATKQRAPFVGRAELEAAAPPALQQRHQPIARLAKREAPAAGGVRLAHHEHATRLHAVPQAGQQCLLHRTRQTVQHVEQQRHPTPRQRGRSQIAFVDRHGLTERLARERHHSRSILDAVKRHERQCRRCLSLVARRQQRQHQAAAAAKVEDAPLIGPSHRAAGVEIHRVEAQLAVRKLPRRNAALEIHLRGIGNQRLVGRRPRQLHAPRHGSRDHPEHRTHHRAANQQVERKAPRVDRPHRVDRQRIERAAPQQAAGLDFGEDEKRRHERVRNVRRQIHLETIEAQQPRGRQADPEMRAVERRAAEEDAE